MKVNYPIKYAAMPIIEQVGWSHGLHDLERDYGVVCYIASKCYVLKEYVVYKEDGSKKKEYEVVFPYQFDHNKWKRVIPSYDYEGRCINCNKVDSLFDSYEDALRYVNSKNNDLCENSYSYMSFSDDFFQKVQRIRDDFDKKLDKYKFLEEKILSQTSDLDDNMRKKLDRTILFNNDETKFFGTLYQVIDLFDSDKFIVYSVSRTHYGKLQQLVRDDKKIGDIEVSSIVDDAHILLVHENRDSLIKLIKPDRSEVYSFKNDSLYPSDELSEGCTIDDDTYVFFTTETFDDVFASYSKHESIDMYDYEYKRNTGKKRVRKSE